MEKMEARENEIHSFKIIEIPRIPATLTELSNFDEFQSKNVVAGSVRKTFSDQYGRNA